MITQAMQWIADLRRPEIIEDKKGHEYLINSEYSSIKESLTPGFKTNSLSSIVDYIENNFDSVTHKFVIHIEDHETVKLYSAAFGPHKQRECFVTAKAETPEFTFGRYYDQETFVVSMLSKFKESDGRDYVMGIASNIVEDEEVKMIDNGLSQTAMFKQGVAAIGNEKITPYVKMIPYRTFIEIDQPASIFLLRLRKGGNLALYEADGGAWKNEAVSFICNYFNTHLEEVDKFSIMA